MDKVTTPSIIQPINTATYYENRMKYLRFLSHYKYLLLFGFLCVFVGNLGQTFFISLFNQDLIQQLAIDNSRLSLVYSIATLTSGFTLFFVGSKIDHLPVKTFSLWVLLGLTAACVLIGWSSNVYLLFFGYLLVRLCGQGLLGHIAVTTLMRYIPEHRGKAVSIAMQGMAVGEIILPLLAVQLLLNTGLSYSWSLYSGLVLLVSIPLLFWLLGKAKLTDSEQQKQLEQSQQQTKQWTRKQVMGDWRFWLMVPALIAPAFLITGIFFQQTALIAAKDWSLQWLSFSLVFYGVLHFVGAIVAGPVVDSRGARRLMRVFLIPLIAGIACLWWGEHKAWLLAFMILAGITVAMSGPVLNTFYADTFGTKHLGAIRAMLSAIMIISTGIAPYLFSLFEVEQLLLLALGFGAYAMVIIQIKLKAEG